MACGPPLRRQGLLGVAGPRWGSGIAGPVAAPSGNSPDCREGRHAVVTPGRLDRGVGVVPTPMPVAGTWGSSGPPMRHLGGSVSAVPFFVRVRRSRDGGVTSPSTGLDPARVAPYPVAPGLGTGCLGTGVAYGIVHRLIPRPGLGRDRSVETGVGDAIPRGHHRRHHGGPAAVRDPIWCTPLTHLFGPPRRSRPSRPGEHRGAGSVRFERRCVAGLTRFLGPGTRGSVSRGRRRVFANGPGLP